MKSVGVILLVVVMYFMGIRALVDLRLAASTACHIASKELGVAANYYVHRGCVFEAGGKSYLIKAYPWAALPLDPPEGIPTDGKEMK